VKISEIMSTLEELGASPRKSLGQNFLHDNNLAHWIVERLELAPGDHVLEIGPGLGALTQWLPLDRVSATLLEKDRLFASFLQERFNGPGVEVKLGDALHYDKRALFCKGEVKLMGNLPYYVSTPLIFHFSAEPCPISRMVLTVQKEVGDRLTASPRSGEYGSLSVLLQRRWEIKRLRMLAPSVFFPRPEVDSLVIELNKKNNADIQEISEQWFAKVVKTGFSERRKKLTNTLAKLLPSKAVEEALAAEGLGALARAEELSAVDWVNLAKRLGGFRSEAGAKLDTYGQNQAPGFNATQPAGVDPKESLQVVDEGDRPIQGVDRATVHAEKLLHRAVHIFVLNSAGELFLQRRSYRKDTFPRKWDSSAAGHVDLGESYEVCATRELREELGLIDQPREIGRVSASEKTGQEFIRIYRAQADEIIDVNEEEIETGGFFPLPVVDEWIRKRPEDFASGFLECYHQVRGGLGAESQGT
jgi:16S rRNA (adenine1518-N6/adenine1519-N6)-dimethyltransferase